MDINACLQKREQPSPLRSLGRSGGSCQRELGHTPLCLGVWDRRAVLLGLELSAQFTGCQLAAPQRLRKLLSVLKKWEFSRRTRKSGCFGGGKEGTSGPLGTRSPQGYGSPGRLHAALPDIIVPIAPDASGIRALGLRLNLVISKNR